MPGEFGEVYPEAVALAVGKLDSVSSSPFEVRWLNVTWLGDAKDVPLFRVRNLMAGASELPPAAHSLRSFLKDLPADLGTPDDFAMTAPATAHHVARLARGKFASGKNFSLGLEDRLYTGMHPFDEQLNRLHWDKYTLTWSVSDRMLTLLNNVTRNLKGMAPKSNAKIGFFAYSNATLPPVTALKAEPELFAQLAPIDFDPIHGMNDSRHKPRREYRDILYAWSRVMDGRLTIYDYDQSMLVWRDLPNPSHQAFVQDVQHYRKAGILGVYTETRLALATTFINLYLRARLLWDPDTDVDALLDDFYEKFYGPAAVPMKAYWSAIFEAWRSTDVTEHEFMVVPAIYTHDLVARLGVFLERARAKLPNPSASTSVTRADHLAIERVRMAELGFAVIRSYVEMLHAAATQVDYAAAAVAGRSGLAARDALTRMNSTFTSSRLENGAAWWAGEVRQYRDLLRLTDGSQGTLVAKLPLEWDFHFDAPHPIDPNFPGGLADTQEWGDYLRRREVELGDFLSGRQWRKLRTDLYAQAQGAGEDGAGWCHTSVTLTPADRTGKVRLMFPGLLQSCRLFVNGQSAGDRWQKPLWWLNDYKFQWDVDVTSRLRDGVNDIALTCSCAHHMCGMFRRPFLYTPSVQSP